MVGDCAERLRELEAESIDTVVTDPPYGLGFMGKAWDHAVPSADVWREVLRVLKPGGHMVAFFGSRTYHRGAVAIEDAGFEIRDQLMWVYGCLDAATQVATIDGVKSYTATSVGDLVLCYDVQNGTYTYQPILEIVEYDYSDTAFRLIGDRGEQVVSRNHRCIVERGGGEAFAVAESLQCEARVPFLEDLPGLLQAVRDEHARAGGAECDVLARMHDGSDRAAECRAEDAVGEAGRCSGPMRRVPSPDMEALSVAQTHREADVQPSLQREASRDGFEDACRERSGSLVQDQRSCVCLADDWRDKSFVEGRADLPKEEGSVCQPVNPLCAMPDGICCDGEKRRVHHGASTCRCRCVGAPAVAHGSGAPHQSRRRGQQAGEPHAVRDERRAQGVRAWRGHRPELVRVVPFQYTGKVWCLRVPTGAFVAVRDGVAFPTGNSGFPKSLDVSKAIDANERFGGSGSRHLRKRDGRGVGDVGSNMHTHRSGANDVATRPASPVESDAARQWNGWGTALKPAHEPIVLARKPLQGTVAANVLEHGTGAINVKACRVAMVDEVLSAPKSDPSKRSGVVGKRMQAPGDKDRNASVQLLSINLTNALGRWPANVAHDGSDEVLEHFPRSDSTPFRENVATGDVLPLSTRTAGGFSDAGSAARFFYTAKADANDRNEGLPARLRNRHPTVKPCDLMRWLARLITPPGGVVLDPFMGSGSTGKAAMLEGFDFIGCELDSTHAEIAELRISGAGGLFCEMESDRK